jgi:hypothetical protein
MEERTIKESPVKAPQPMDRSEQLSGGTQAPVALRVPDDAGAGQVADAMIATLQAVDAALAPIIGPRGVAALYQRSVFLASGANAWLAALQDGVDGRIDLEALKTHFAQQPGADARAGGNALLQTFHDLLASLIGASLTARLLQPVWAAPSTTLPQDTSP